MKKHLSKLLTREQAYFLHATIIVQFDELKEKHKIDTDTLKLARDLVHETIKFYTIKEK